MFLDAYVKQPPLAGTLVAFNGGIALFAGEGDAADLTKPFDVEIGLTGSYKTRNFELSTKQFEEMIANHQAAGVDPAIDREHESWFSFAAQPALGWVRGMRVGQATGDARRKALIASVQLNDLGQKAVSQGHFRYVSMGFDKAGKHRMSGEPIGAVLDHLALVKNPFIQGMRPLSLALSSRLGRPVEEEPMEQLAQQLRTMLGLSADASEEQIIKAFEALSARTAKALKDSEEKLAASVTLSKDLDEQKRVNVRLETELTRLSKADEERGAREWASAVDLAVKEFRLTPAEAEEYKALTGAERAVTARLLAKRTAQKPAQEVVKLPGAVGDKSSQALKLMADYQKAHPEADAATAYAACASEHPALFAEEA